MPPSATPPLFLRKPPTGTKRDWANKKHRRRGARRALSLSPFLRGEGQGEGQGPARGRVFLQPRQQQGRGEESSAIAKRLPLTPTLSP